MSVFKPNMYILVTLIAFFLCLAGNPAIADEPPAAMAKRKALQGQYKGNLPCADCPGIEYRLQLNSDGTYTESTLYEERSQMPLVKKGTYSIEGDVVTLQKEGAGFKFFREHPKGLMLLDINKAPISGDLSHRYILARTTPSGETMLTHDTLVRMQQKMNQGISFYATGNEPGWTLDIDFNKGMRFKLSTGPTEILTPPASEARAQDADVTRYFAKTETDTLIVSAHGKPCVDTMSGGSFPFQVRIETKRSGDADYTSFEGCGRYVVDPRLNDIWILRSFNGRELEAQTFPRTFPTLEFHLADNMIGGSTGCNRISGPFNVRGDKIRFSAMATTRMACYDMAFENAFLSAITPARILRYAISDGELTLTDGQEITMLFKKVD